MSLIPKSIDKWSYGAIYDLVKNNVFENEIFDYKVQIPYPSDLKGKLRLKKTISAFANSGGGFLIFGVKDEGSTIEDRMIGFDKKYDFPVNFGNFPSQCSPSVEWSFAEKGIPIDGKSEILHVVQIISTWIKPHAVEENNSFYFMKRTNKGDEEMSYEEVKKMFQENEYRRTKLALLNAELQSIIEISNQLINNENFIKFVEDENIGKDKYVDSSFFLRFSTYLLDQILGDVYSFIADDPSIWKNLNNIRSQIIKANSIHDLLYDKIFKNQSTTFFITFQSLQACLLKLEKCAETTIKDIEKLLAH